MKILLSKLTITVVLSFLIVLCGKAESLKVVTTCGMVTSIVEEVAGEVSEVEGLMGSGVDPHLYKPTRSDVLKMADADVIFYSGLMLEGRMADTFARMSRKGKKVYAVTELLDDRYLMEPEEFEGHWDPHVWNDVSAWKKATEMVVVAMSEVDPANAATYKSKGEAYMAKLAELDAYVRKVLATIPKEKRYLITAHDAFGYFARAYDIEVRSVQGVSTASAAGVDDINQLVDFIVEKDISAIFVENITSDKGLQAVVEGCRSRGHDVVIGGTLFSDAMGADGTYEGTYLGMVDHNATLIARALGGQAPEKGLNGKLTLEE
ncbi:MAG: zinc ABC transporter substrate-binding protein [Verrucomicrobiota bacterium]